MAEPPLVLVTEESDPTPLAWLRERARVVEAAPGTPEFDAALPDAVGMVVRTRCSAFDNVLLTPHVAARTHTAVENMSWVVRDVVEVLNGRRARYPTP